MLEEWITPLITPDICCRDNKVPASAVFLASMNHIRANDVEYAFVIPDGGIIGAAGCTHGLAASFVCEAALALPVYGIP